jgi:SAM-dependent methyltransferase
MYSARDFVDLKDCGFDGARQAFPSGEFSPTLIDWDRTSRLQSVASAVGNLNICDGVRILDVGGGDGALSFFLPSHTIFVVDPVTTGGDGLNLPFPNEYFDVVVSIDAVEHVQPSDRAKFISECLRVCAKTFIVHYPEFKSMKAQQLVHTLFPNNPFICEHVEYILPTENELQQMIRNCHPDVSVTSNYHMPVIVWLFWFCSFYGGLDKESQVTRYLDSNSFQGEPYLYNVLVCKLA